MTERIVISITLIVLIVWFLSGNFGATTSIFSDRISSLPDDIAVKGEEKEIYLEEINKLFKERY